jgi:hypothetical protein
MTQTIQKVTQIISKQPAVRFSGKYVEDAPLYFGNGAQDIDQKRGPAVVAKRKSDIQ